MKYFAVALSVVMLFGAFAAVVPQFSYAQTSSSIPGSANGFGRSSNTSSIPGNAAGCASESQGLTNPLNTCDFFQLLSEVMDIVVKLGVVFLTIMLMYVGLLFVQARGAEEKLTQARTALLWTVVGGLMLLGAKAIATAITETAKSL